jgi:probable HAF family extracellular repeat protein
MRFFFQHRQTLRRKSMATRLRVEALEDRCCPSASYAVTDLGTLGGANSYAYAINNANSVQVVGSASTASGFGHAFLYSSGAMKDLGTLSGDTYSIATALNDSGQVVGTSDNSSGGTTLRHAFLWQASTGMIDLGNLGAAETWAQAVDNPTAAHPFQVVGYGEITAGGGDHAWLWQNGIMTDLNALIPSNSGWVLTSANGINNNQQIVGQGTFNSQYHAFLWQVGGGAPTDLGVLPGGNMSQANAINGSGQVAGTSFIATGGTDRAFSWTSPGPMTNLGILPKDFQSEALALNNLAHVQVVGISESSGAYDRAVLWQGGKVIDLNNQLPKNSGWLVQRADGVNDAGSIVGEGGNGSGLHAVLLTPISGEAPMAAASITSSLSAAAVQIGSFTANPNPATSGSPVTLTAAGVTTLNAGSTVTQVAFYLDSNRDGVLEPATDTLLGYGTQSSTGTWTFTFSTAGWAPGGYRLFAQAEDSSGLFGDPLALTLQVL